ncbi:putative GTPase (plasmid) [Ensifer sp. WSM1721]
MPGQSRTKDRLEFERLHVDDWVVISAIHSEHHPDMTEVIATRGGKRDEKSGEARFLVPRDDYARRHRVGFVIDPNRHAAYDGPSSFVGWQGRTV